MIKDIKQIREEMLRDSEARINKFIDELEEMSDGNEFTIDNIELLMSKFNKDSREELIKPINTIFGNYDETKIIEEKKD